MGRLEGNFTGGTTEAGLPQNGSISVSYRGDDPAEPDNLDAFGVMIDRAVPRQRPEEMHSATVAATCGEAMLVPEIVRLPPPGHDERMQTPGPATM